MRVGKCLGPIIEATKQFDTQTNAYRPHGTYSKAAIDKDITKIVDELVKYLRYLPFV